MRITPDEWTAAIPGVFFGLCYAVLYWHNSGHTLRRITAHEDQALALAATAGPPPQPVLSGKHLEALGQLATRRRFAKPIDIANAQMLTDSCRVACPHLTDTELGVLMLDMHGYMVAAQRGARDGAWAMARMTAAMGIAAVELTDLERLEAL